MENNSSKFSGEEAAALINRALIMTNDGIWRVFVVYNLSYNTDSGFNLVGYWNSYSSARIDLPKSALIELGAKVIDLENNRLEPIV